MRAITITRHGGPDVLEVREYPDPTPTAGQVRVQVKACGLNFAELMARQGLYPAAPKPPCVVGYEAAGVVDAIGEGVDDYAIGDRVLLAVKFGAHAELVCADVQQVYPMPENMSFEEGAALPVNYLTAHHMLTRVAFARSGDHLLVHAAGGGVGTAVLQLCRAIGGITTYGTASPGKHDLIREQGCTHAIDYRNKDYVEEVRRLTDGEGVDVVLDALGGQDWAKGYDLLKPMGRLVAFGFSNMTSPARRNVFKVAWQWLRMPRFAPLNMMNDNRAIAGVSLGDLWEQVDLLRSEMTELLPLYERGLIRPRVDSVFTFDRAHEAHEHMMARRNVGKVILIP
ncbi:MAG: zinc-binding dehydrogenase [Myxococcales bacterium]|nr:zinc-binding dehydrogenase [Myxococcales bacterium]